MEVRVTPAAAEELKKMIADKGGSLAVRVYTAGIG
ncbi:hypothetical protein EDD71_12315 [Fonticella tunisiensis]|nr:iron-sulfur cluster biosynthesis family protein [Fonticella tunisiensis]TDT50920.1 hypothetical protein EDD71_12315 [Fonticella tunisiensis]